MKNSNFQKIYQQLNNAQKKAVNTIDGPVMVVAGPGTGKTQILAARIANILRKTDTDPTSILALTFTDSAAKNMRERLLEMIGKTAFYVQISTFHSFCSDIIRAHPEFFPIEKGSEALSTLERYDIFQALIDKTDLEILKPLNAPYFYLKEMIQSISNLKRENINIKQFKKIVKDLEKEVTELDKIYAEESAKKQRKKTVKKSALNKKKKQLAKNKELISIYQKYEKELRSKARYDFDDMIALVSKAFNEHEFLLREYQENIHYFLVDEYQDTNNAQNQIVDLLASYWGDQANIFVVGDPNQAIYRFQGASVENTLGFSKRYSAAKVINLAIGYRCPQTIYNAADELIAENKLITEHRALKSTKGQGTDIKVFKAPVQTLENIYVAEEIDKLIKQGTNPSEIAILFRHNRDAVELMNTLDKWDIRYEIDSGFDILADETINQLLVLFQVIVDLRTSAENELLFALMQYPWLDLDPLLVMKIARLASKTQGESRSERGYPGVKTSIIDLINNGYEKLIEKYEVENINALEFSTLTDFIQKLFMWSSLDLTVTFNEYFERILKESGFLAWILKQDTKIELLNSINSLFNQIKALTAKEHQFKLANFLKTIATMREHQLPIKIEDLNIRKNAVHLSTVHKAKGREWEYVFLIHVVDKKWGNNIKRELIPLPENILQNTDLSIKERNEDERRLFYVAITRAKKEVTICYPETIIANSYSRDVTGSIFLEELSKLKTISDKKIINNADKYLAKLVSPAETKKIKIDEKEFFSKIVKNFKLSVTALNTYLRDPKEFVENVLLRVPRAKPIPMAFGTAVHDALENFYKKYQEEGKQISVKELLANFETALKNELLNEEKFKKHLKYGKEILTQYYEEYKDEKVDPVFIERFFGSGFSKTYLDDIPLTGRIDRVDWVDRKKKTVLLIDYKTGNPKTVGQIEGKTMSANLSEREQNLPDSIKGSYKRQLLFYKLLTQLDRSFIPTASHGMFDFIQPHKQTNKLVRRKFELKDSDVDDLKKLIKKVMEEIRELKFLEIT